ncbi:hypothetical protein Dimus_000996 [Dionaea muscipula]
MKEEIGEPDKSDAKAYGDWLTMVFQAFNVPLINKQGAEPKRYDFFEETFLNMCQLKREQGVWWLKIETEISGESGSVEKFYDAEDEVQGAADVVEEVPEVPTQVSAQQKETTAAGVDLSVPVGSIPDTNFQRLQAEFERS